MKTTLYYFTGTGNSLFIANKLSEQLDEANIIPIAKIINNDSIIADTERVGFIFPLYYWGLPEIIERFIKKINLDKAKSIFYVSSSGGGSSNDCVSGKIKKILSKKDKVLNGGFRIIMPGNYIKMYNLDNSELQKEKLKRSVIKIKRVVEDINSDKMLVKKDRRSFIAQVTNNIWMIFVNRSDKGFTVNENCNSCGICEKICPVNNIKFENGKSIWNHNCQECLSCVHNCPQKAINSKKRITEKLGQYKHPDLTINDLINQK